MANILYALNRLDAVSVLDILLVAALIFAGLYIIRGTPAVQLLRGLLVLIAITGLLSNFLHLTAFNWLIRNTLPALLLAIPVIFQPELRRALERIGRAGSWLDRPVSGDPQRAIGEIARAVGSLSKQKLGALIVIEQKTGLQQFVDTGVAIDGVISGEL